MFDYMYYRIATWYFRRERKGKLSVQASMLVSLSQILIITDIGGLIILETLEASVSSQLMKQYSPLYIGIILLISFYNDWRYKGKYERYHERWMSEGDFNRNIRGIGVIILILVPLLFLPFLLNIVDYNK